MSNKKNKIKYVECVPNRKKVVRILHCCQILLPSTLIYNTEIEMKHLERMLRKK